ncbi:hypothetical protein ACF07F_19620 [Streptomyces sp. NPDC015237]|uniref:hypothetical protein n=1 Tax=Streptomyces sp. NPDC015237 TaxID=3364949 RepID=UPI0036F6881C
MGHGEGASGEAAGESASANGIATERNRTGASSAGIRLGFSRTGEGHTAIEPLDTDLTEIRPLERRVDSVFRVRVAGEEGGFVLAVESQG